MTSTLLALRLSQVESSESSTEGAMYPPLAPSTPVGLGMDNAR